MNREKIPETTAHKIERLEKRLAEAEKAISENETLLLAVGCLANTLGEAIIRMRTPWWKKLLKKIGRK